ncbi:MAG: peptide deformylase [Candidatus Margulisbacteria bacterium]|nr:peptide deformylase [Candidatus Margulisiibacteriota bacterium]
MLRKIIRFPHPVLKKKAKAVKRVTTEIVRLIDDMIETMQKAPGVGLAAPQVGESIRVIVADIGTGAIAVINPKIIKKSGKQCLNEGCLSLPGVEAPVERAAHVIVTGLDRTGKKATIEAKELLATILQHEVDHLEGLVLVDRVSDPSLIKHVPPASEKKEELI